MIEQWPSSLLIVGAGGHGRVIADVAELAGWNKIAFLDDRYPDLQRTGAWPVLGKIEDASALRDAFRHAAVGVGDNKERARLIEELCRVGFELPKIVHPSAAVSRYASISDGTVVFAQVAVNVGARLGLGCILNTGAKIDHDCIVGDFVHVSPGASLAGGVVVGERSWIGIGASVRHQVAIGKDVIVGAGAAVVTNLPDGITVVGVPARDLAVG